MGLGNYSFLRAATLSFFSVCYLAAQALPGRPAVKMHKTLSQNFLFFVQFDS